jgi:Na+-translocating ferredoxin:NAD+ oxidoreductase RnfC subunit
MTLNDIKNIGVVGAGGAGFPTHVKLSAQPDTLIMNAAECEPLVHKDIELLRNYSDLVIKGFNIAKDITGAGRGIIGIKEKNKEVIEQLRSQITNDIEIFPLADFYPAGDEITLIYLTTGRLVQPGELPITVGCIVQNVETLFNIAKNVPVVEKYIAIAGAVSKPATIKIPVGTSYKDILENFKITVPRYVVRSGGLMMGELESNDNGVIDKRTGALIVLPVDHYCVTMYRRFSTPHDTDRIAKAGCDQCNFCTELCPRYLLGHPVRPETAMRNRMFTREGEPYIDLGSAFCCECNLCTLYACPESLDPKGATVIEKRIVQEQGLRWEGLPVKIHPMMRYRQVSIKKLKQRLDLMQFKDEGPLMDIDFKPQIVRIPLNQHAGKPATALVKKGDLVQKNDLIGQASAEISANIHCSISGKVFEVNEEQIIIQGTK